MRRRDLVALEFDRVRQRLADFASSPGGKQAALAILPSSLPTQVEAEIERVDQTTRLIERAGRLPLGDFPDVRELLGQAGHAGYILDGPALLAIRHVLDSAHFTAAFLARQAGAFAELTAKGEQLDPLPTVRATLLRAIDDHGEVTDDASDELAEVRRRLRNLRAQLTRRLEEMLSKPGIEDLLSDRYITLRNNRFVLPVKTVSLYQLDGVVQDRSVSGETTFVEPPFAVELNNRLLIAAREEESIVRRILADLTEVVRTESATITATYDVLVELDLLQARAAFGLEYRCVRPQIDSDRVELYNARHPALLFGTQKVTPIDLLLPPGKAALLVTGPNTGGKTVALKTLGLLALMTQSGIPIPADQGSRLPCFPAIYADIGDDQSIERSLSTFSSHLANIAEIIEQGVGGTLVLLDEPGVGTDPEEGAALGVGVIRYLESAGARVAATTHYTALKVFALSDESAVCAAVDFDAQTMRPLFRLVYHTVGESLALPIAQRLGLPRALLESAQKARGEQAHQLEAAMSELESARRHYEEKARVVEQALSEARRDREEAGRLLAELREKRKQRWSDELDRARAYLRQVREQGRELLAAVERGETDRRAFTRAMREQEAGVALRLAELEDKPAVASAGDATPPGVGDQVEVPGSEIRGELVSVQGVRAWIQRGSMRFEVPRTGLRRTGGGTPPANRPVAVRLAEKPEGGAQEISLIGMRVKEALERLEDFLDHAVQEGMPSVRIIHGMGSGALRRAVGEYLSTSPYCQSFRPGESVEGGTGATVATLAVG